MTNKQQLIRRIRHGAPGARCCLGIVVTVGASAYAPSPDPVHQTVEYYRANREARETKVAECANDPGELGKTPDCINAMQAAQLESIGSLRDLPPMGLVPDKKQGSSSASDASGNSPRNGENQR